jgi:lambda family phage minor tail protein L
MMQLHPNFLPLFGGSAVVDLAGQAAGQATASGYLTTPSTKQQQALKAQSMGVASATGSLSLGKWVLLFDASTPDDGATLALDLVKLRHSKVLELYVLDATALGGDVLRFYAGTNELLLPLVWQGQLYTPFPIEVSGFASSSDGPIARPTLRAANPDGLLGALIRQFSGLKGAKLTRKRTLAKYLDAVNFASGNPHADPYSEFPDDVYRLDRITTRNKRIVEYQLTSDLDVQGVRLPRRLILHSVCVWTYRGADCGYTGPPVAKADDTPTAVMGEDRCSHKLSGCRLRPWPGKQLPFGGFPGAGVLRNA